MKKSAKTNHFLVEMHKKQRFTKKRQVFGTVVFIFLFFNFLTSIAQNDSTSAKTVKKGVKTVVIDAGHGGHDPGCLGSSAREKHVCLGVALKLGKLIQSYFPDVNVVYTRDKDVFVKLYERADIANKNNADLFISIHANSAQAKAAHGTETFVMGTKYVDRNLETMKRENSVVDLESDDSTSAQSKYGGYDPNNPMTLMILGLYQQEFLKNSTNFANKIENQFVKRNGRHSRGVRQRVLLVMYRTQMPSVLIETGFLTNKEDHDLLKDPKGQAETAGAVFRAFLEYKREIEGASAVEIAKEEAEAFKKWPSMLKSVLEVDVAESELKEIEEKVEKGVEESKETITQLKEKEDSVKMELSKPGDLVFKVQISSSSKKIEVTSRKFKGLNEISFYETNGLYKYTYGNCKNEEEAKLKLEEAKKVGFKDAWIIAFYKGERVSIKKARELYKQGKT